ncbi:hypothetical protein [Achromobacter aegrifaciens]|uniref:hypothetical protein n=1 Tax=Achromobacter aegrifaciens TaxID=1287736 RepID=UPI000F7392A8|nr:hypothetical protein [Achromobacter aegrifaciens]RSE91207.1 hypothetical protein EGU54_30930 [Achromobacter aegrifaciens]
MIAPRMILVGIVLYVLGDLSLALGWPLLVQLLLWSGSIGFTFTGIALHLRRGTDGGSDTSKERKA